jgi:ATP-dependent DNA helicase RecG
VQLNKDSYSEEELQQLGLNERQIDAILYIKEKGYITTSEYMKHYAISERTARNDLNRLIEIKLLNREGETNTARYLFTS